jgi:hypothetical protein
MVPSEDSPSSVSNHDEALFWSDWIEMITAEPPPSLEFSRAEICIGLEKESHDGALWGCGILCFISRKILGFVEDRATKAMFVFWNSLFGKLFSKLSCVYLPLGKLVNGKHFPVKGEHFPVNEKHFRVKEKFGLVSRKVFSLWLCLFFGKWFPGNHFPNFPVFVCH